jgi:hypothetical protein
VIEMKPAAVKEGELLSVQTYRLIGAQRPGMTYAPATSGGLGGEIEFTATKSGMFTRNFIQSESGLAAEIK